eukprot:1591686-Amphidinium_carterae.1
MCVPVIILDGSCDYAGWLAGVLQEAALGKGQTTASIPLDPTKAIENIPHEMLLRNPITLGFPLKLL